MATPRKTIDVIAATKAEGLKTLAAEFPPGTSAWAFWDALVSHSLKEFRAGRLEVLGQKTKHPGAGGSSAPRPRMEPKAPLAPDEAAG